MADNDSGSGSGIGIAGIVAIIIIMLACFTGDDSDRESYTPRSSGTRQSSTEDLLRQSYDDAGIEYDEQMLREDARAVESLNDEFGY